MRKKRVTIKDIAHELGISPMTVSLALRDSSKLREQTRRRVEEAAEKMGYQRNLLARGLVQNKSFLVGVVVPYIAYSFYPEILQGIEDQAYEKHYSILLYNSAREIRREGEIMKMLIHKQVDGVIASPELQDRRPYEQLLELGIPLLFIMLPLHETDVPAILVDNQRGAYDAVLHLARQGHRRIAHLSVQQKIDAENIDRLQGYKKALLDTGLHEESKGLDFYTPDDFDSFQRLAMNILQLKPRPTAIFCVHDVAGMAVLRAAKTLGLNVPDQVAVVGFDDEIHSRRLETPLSSVAQPKYQVGELAFQKLLAMIEGENIQTINLRPHLVVRESSQSILSETSILSRPAHDDF